MALGWVLLVIEVTFARYVAPLLFYSALVAIGVYVLRAPGRGTAGTQIIGWLLVVSPAVIFLGVFLPPHLQLAELCRTQGGMRFYETPTPISRIAIDQRVAERSNGPSLYLAPGRRGCERDCAFLLKEGLIDEVESRVGPNERDSIGGLPAGLYAFSQWDPSLSDDCDPNLDGGRRCTHHRAIEQYSSKYMLIETTAQYGPRLIYASSQNILNRETNKPAASLGYFSQTNGFFTQPFVDLYSAIYGLLTHQRHYDAMQCGGVYGNPVDINWFLAEFMARANGSLPLPPSHDRRTMSFECKRGFDRIAPAACRSLTAIENPIGAGR